MHSLSTFLIFIGFLGFLGFAAFKIVKERSKTPFRTKVILIAILIFALTKITLFSFMKAYFDWYYWLPRVFLFAVILYYLLNFVPLRKRLLIPSIFVFFLGLYFFQLLQSYTIGYMEETQRVQIAKDIQRENTSIHQSILLEPAGKIPFFTGLYTYDEVGLVNKRINDEMLKDESYWWMNSVRDFEPDFVLTIVTKPGGSYYQMKPQDHRYFDDHYKFVKSYPIAEIHQNAPKVLRWIYGIRPIGKDYYLYKKR